MREVPIHVLRLKAIGFEQFADDLGPDPGFLRVRIFQELDRPAERSGPDLLGEFRPRRSQRSVTGFAKRNQDLAADQFVGLDVQLVQERLSHVHFP